MRSEMTNTECEGHGLPKKYCPACEGENAKIIRVDERQKVAEEILIPLEKELIVLNRLESKIILFDKLVRLKSMIFQVRKKFTAEGKEERK